MELPALLQSNTLPGSPRPTPRFVTITSEGRVVGYHQVVKLGGASCEQREEVGRLISTPHPVELDFWTWGFLDLVGGTLPLLHPPTPPASFFWLVLVFSPQASKMPVLPWKCREAFPAFPAPCSLPCPQSAPPSLCWAPQPSPLHTVLVIQRMWAKCHLARKDVCGCWVIFLVGRVMP